MTQPTPSCDLCQRPLANNHHGYGMCVPIEKQPVGVSQTTKFEIELTGKWDASSLRVLADVVDVIELIPPEKRQQAIELAMRSLEIDRNKSGIRLVVDNG